VLRTAHLPGLLRQILPLLWNATYADLFGCDISPLANATQTATVNVISGAVLANGQRYNFYYNIYAEVARIELPSGGAIEYEAFRIYGRRI